jgi:hypothetical protein
VLVLNFLESLTLVLLYFLVAPGFERRALCLLVAGVLPLELCSQPLCFIFQTGSHTFATVSLDGDPPIYTSEVARMARWAYVPPHLTSWVFLVFSPTWTLLLLVFVCFLYWGFDLRTYTSNHSTSPFLWRVFSREGPAKYLPWPASYRYPPSLCLLGISDYRCEPLDPALLCF